MDQFFALANSVRVALGRPVPELQSFLHDQAVLARTRDTDLEAGHLAARDEKMVENTAKYLRAHPAMRSVVLIIGYAHLPNLTKRLSDAGYAVIAGSVAASRAETEPWEIRAWQQRSRPAVRVFSKASARKELSRLLDSAFKDETQATIRKLQELEAMGTRAIPAGKARLFEVPSPGSGTKAVVAGNLSGMERANWGSYVVDRGYLPNSAQEPYLIIDREILAARAKALSTRREMFVPTYRTKAGQALETKVATQSGTISIERFKAAPPKDAAGQIPERVILIGEPDGGATYRALQTAGGRGGGAPPWTTTTSAFADPAGGGRRPPRLLQTINPERARQNLDALAKQEPLRWGNIETVRFGVGPEAGGPLLESLWFTRERGDHAQAFLVVGENTTEFRSQLKIAAEAGLFRNKQIALASCFDSEATPAIREMLLDAGALVVWSPERKITPAAAEKLATYLERSATTGEPKALDDLVPAALKLWQDEAGANDADLRSLIDGSRWVHLDLPRLPWSREVQPLRAA
jgi:hypothetical protein